MTIESGGRAQARTTGDATAHQDGDESQDRTTVSADEDVPGGDTSDELPLDQVFEILKNERRRHVLQHLKERDDPVPIGDLAEHIAALENDKSVNELSSGERKRVYVGLYQCHLPKMDDMDIVSFNKPRGLIEPGENADVFDRYMETEEESDRQWHRYYLAASGTSVPLLAVAAVVNPLLALPLLSVAVGVVVTGFLAISLAHTIEIREDDDQETGPQTDHG